MHGRSFQGHRVKQKADWLTGQTKGGPDPAQAPRLGGIHHQSLDQVSLTYLPRYLGSIMSASRTTVQEYRLTATYCVSRGASYSASPPPSLPVATLEVLRGQLSPKCSLRQQQSSGRPASLRVLSSNPGTLTGSDSPLETCLCAANPPMPSSHSEEHHGYQSSQ